MANVGDKYIIEIDKKLVGLDHPDGKAAELYRIKGFNSLVFDENGLGKLERFDPDEKANADYDAGYREGMHEAWQAAKKIALIEELGGMSFDEIMEAFGRGGDRVFTEMDPDEVIRMLNRYERDKERKAKEIHVGDEVKGIMGTWVVLRIDGARCYGVSSDSLAHNDMMGALTKTGRSFPEVKTLLEKMEEETAE